MARMGDIEREAAEAAAAYRRFEHRVLQDLHLHKPHDTQTPAATPVTVETAAPAARPEGEPMSLVTDVEDGYAALKGELAKFDAALPGALEKAKKFEASPFAALVEKAASTVLPPAAVASVVRVADAALTELIGLYNPQGVQQQEAPAGPVVAGQA